MTDERQLRIARELEAAEVYDGDWEFRLLAWINDGGLEALIRLATKQAEPVDPEMCDMCQAVLPTHYSDCSYIK